MERENVEKALTWLVPHLGVVGAPPVAWTGNNRVLPGPAAHHGSQRGDHASILSSLHVPKFDWSVVARKPNRSPSDNVPGCLELRSCKGAGSLITVETSSTQPGCCWQPCLPLDGEFRSVVRESKPMCRETEERWNESPNGFHTYCFS